MGRVRSWCRRAFIAGAVIISWGIAPPPAAPAAPRLELGQSSVTVHLGSPGGKVVLFGFVQQERQQVLYLTRHEAILEDTERDGVVTYEPERGLPLTSVWVGVDLATGDSDVAAPAGLSLRELRLPPQAIDPSLRRLDLPLAMAEVTLVRPGADSDAGAWGLRVGDGGASDEDRTHNGTLRFAVGEMWSVDDSPPPPEKLRKDDVLLVIDPNDLALLVVRLTGGGL